jgi:hypothetical protein
MERVMKDQVTVVPRHGYFYKVHVVTGGKPAVRQRQPVQNGERRISAEDAAQKIVQRFGRSLAVLAD